MTRAALHNCSHHPLLAVSDALEVLREGTRNRQVAATDMNAASSRSHCIFTCHIESRLEPQPGMVNVRSSRLHLVDLAGSERLKTSWASAVATAVAAGGTGAAVSSSWDGGSMSGGGGGGGNSRLRETTSINSSLTVLGLVILRLTEQQPHIPYRNSKLTFLLQVCTWSWPGCLFAWCSLLMPAREGRVRTRYAATHDFWGTFQPMITLLKSVLWV